MLETLRSTLHRLHLELPRQGLVTWTSGNLSTRDPQSDLVVIKPSGVMYEELTPENMVILDLDGNVIEGQHKPSSDTATHLYIYRNRPDVGGIVHTHSTYATAFAANGRPIPPVLTAICDEFGGEYPGRQVCSDWRRRNRKRSRCFNRRQPRHIDAKSRRIHDRPQSPGGIESRSHGRRCRQDGFLCIPAGQSNNNSS